MFTREYIINPILPQAEIHVYNVSAFKGRRVERYNYKAVIGLI